MTIKYSADMTLDELGAWIDQGDPGEDEWMERTAVRDAFLDLAEELDRERMAEEALGTGRDILDAIPLIYGRSYNFD